MATDEVLVVDRLRKRFGEFVAVDGISFGIRRGQVLGLLGPNGAGKTTTIHMLLGLTSHDGGSIRYFGRDLGRHRAWCLQRINFTSSYNTLQGRITVGENLLVFAGLYGVREPRTRIQELSGFFEMDDLLDRRYWNLSAGERTRVNLVKALLNQPELLLMDEPTASLDPDIADKTLAMVERLRDERGLSILFTSHNMAEVSRICDEVVFLDRGRIVAHDSPQALTRRIPTARLRLRFASAGLGPATAWLETANVVHSPLEDHSTVITTTEGEIPRLLLQLGQVGVEITDVEIAKPTLEDVFLQIARGE